jgi:SAM-dependent methyltransferase
MKNLIRKLVTSPIPALKSRLRVWQTRRSYRKAAPREVFSRIYRSKAWGSHPDKPFCSGEGSSREDLVGPYCDKVRAFVQKYNMRHIVDLGCGDFGVGSGLLSSDLRYTAVDIVPELVQYNRQRFVGMNVDFQCLNIIDDALPSGDLCLVRQVLQHLSNAQISRVLNKLRDYEYAILTEHVYCGIGWRPNVDKPHGPGTRIPARSGVFLEAGPFHCKAEMLIEIPVTMNSVMRTIVIDMKSGVPPGR